jgi:hypothetical protein
LSRYGLGLQWVESGSWRSGCDQTQTYSPSLQTCFPNEFNAKNPLILPLSRHGIIGGLQGDGEGAKACDLRGLGVRSSGRARRRRFRKGPRPSSSGAGRARNTDTALMKGLAARQAWGDPCVPGPGDASPARPSGAKTGEVRTGPTARRSRITIARSVGLSRNGILYKASGPGPALRVPPRTSPVFRVRRPSCVQRRRPNVGFSPACP